MIEANYQKTRYRAGLHLGGHAAAGVSVEVGAVVPAAAHALAVELETKAMRRFAKISQSRRRALLAKVYFYCGLMPVYHSVLIVF